MLKQCCKNTPLTLNWIYCLENIIPDHDLQKNLVEFPPET